MTSADVHQDESDLGNRQAAIWPLIVTLVGWLLISGASKWAYEPPVPVPATASGRVFSAERAEKYLKELVGDGIPHPAGSEQNRIVADRVKSTLESMGYVVEMQFAERPIKFSRGSNEPASLTIRNLIAKKAGDNKLGAVLLACHYDSVPYGPGASDDGVAVAAVLEIAAMVQSNGWQGRDLIFLFSDGEEYGLLGAGAFVEENDLVDEIEFVVNLEARGTSGPSLMFQTSSDSAQMVSLFSDVVLRPVTSSIFEEIYKRLPNDTDFTIFRDQAGMRGFNFAFIRDANNYHTPNDNLQNADRGSLQHHGENAWALVQALSRFPAEPKTNRKFVYFDWFGNAVIRWRADYSLKVSILILILFIGSRFVENWKSGFGNLREGFVNDLAVKLRVAGAIFAAVFLCCFLSFSFNLQEKFRPPWVDHPELVTLSFWVSAATVLIWFLSLFEIAEPTAWFVVWFSWTLLALVTSMTVVGASYLFLVPAAGAVVLRLVFFEIFSKRRKCTGVHFCRNHLATNRRPVL